MQNLAKLLNFNRKTMINVAIGLVLAILCSYFVFSKVNFNDIVKAIEKANVFYLCIAFLVSVFSHWLRALRFNLLLKPLTDQKISLFNTFSTIMFGYSINIAIPRAGEIARTVFFSQLENLPISLIAPTVVMERLLDILVLGLMAILSFYLLPQRIAIYLPWLKGVSVTLFGICMVGFSLVPIIPSILNKMAKYIKINKLEDIISQVENGFKCLNEPKLYPGIALYTFLMWAMYLLNYVAVLASLHLAVKDYINVLFTTFLAGSLSVLIPTPGCAGSFHLIVSETLSHLSTITLNQAIIFATVLHFICFILTTILPSLVCAIILMVRKIRLKV